MSKTCSKCKKEKDLSDFNKNRSRRDGLSIYCRICDRKKVNAYLKTPEGAQKQRVRQKRNQKARVSKNPNLYKELHEKECDLLRVRYGSYKKSARVKELDFEISKEKFRSITSQPCYYCGEFTRKDFVGMDRIDNGQGYVESNLVPCCKFCNYARRQLSQQEFIRKVMLIYEKHGAVA